jgi:hypothetical protein
MAAFQVITEVTHLEIGYSQDLAAFRCPTQSIGWPRLSIRGFTPKSLLSESAQLKRTGLRRFSCFSTANTAADIRRLDRGARSPK